ncbi:hypothetical protein C8Q70DRAFT_262856 [Cubamyces menziesii]|uniref:Uncharacterized protein n=1 Tax=Trametes cubensis TaxID=1111947 RepID=A0AAD7XES9_9APHY|nr:hypothetical protein C8Q70DRAFT_262856 [Cubamyces menziesii]KAJ8490114.1 hypothetical protein ONZ51_g2491 [Trametes cubensis]
MSAPSSSTNGRDSDIIFPHPAHRAFIFNGRAMHVDIPRTNARALTGHTTPGHGHTNVRLPTPLDTPGHGHTNVSLFAAASPLWTPGHGHTNVSLFAVSSTPTTPGHGHTNVSLLSLASPHADSPSTPTQPRPAGRASRRSLFSSAADSDERADASQRPLAGSLPSTEESDEHDGAELHELENRDSEEDFGSMSEDDSDRA